MGTPLRVLIVEDSEDDALLLLWELRHGGYDPTYTCVDRPAAMRAALEASAWDLVISDYALPHFNAPAALALLQEIGRDLPFIVVSGTIGEATAVAMMKAGAHDYLIKGHLARLAPAVARELREAEERQARRQAQEQLRQAETRYRTLIEQIPAVTYIVTLDGASRGVYVSPQIVPMLGFSPAEWNADRGLWLRQLHADDRERVLALDARCRATGEPFRAEYRLLARDGRVVWVSDRGGVIHDGADRAASLHGVLFDITERKSMEAAEREQRAFAEALRDIAAALNSTLDFDGVLEAILANVSRVVPHDSANVMLVEGEAARLVRWRSMTQAGSEKAAMTQRLPVAQFHTLGHMVATRQPLVISDTQAYAGWVDTPETAWIRSYAGMPIRSQEQVIGFLNLNSGTPGFFVPMHGDRLRAFADQAAVAIQNARLYEAAERRASEFAALYETASDLAAPRNLTALLQTIVDRATNLLDVPNGAIFLYDPVREDLELVAARNPQLPVGSRLPTVGGLAERLTKDRQPIIVNDLSAQDSRLPGLAHLPFAALVLVPMLYGGELTGVLGVGQLHGRQDAPREPSPREFTEAEARLLSLFAAQAASVVHNARLFNETERRLKQLQALRAVDSAIGSSLDLRLTLSILLNQVLAQLKVDAADVLLLNPHTQVLEFVVGRGFRRREVEQSRLRLGEGHAGRATLERRVVYVPDLSQATTEFVRAPLLKGEGFVAYYGVPLIAKGQIKGVLDLFHRAPLDPSADWLEFLETLAGQASIAIDNATLFDDLQRSNLELALAYDSTLEGWSRALDLRDKETEGHTQRVTELTLRLARAVGLREPEFVQIRRGALLHDIGKMGIPDSILLKPGPLTEGEWAIMRQHPVYAYEMLSPIAFLRPALDIPYCHHERWDGTGYPRGLKGEQIPQAARLFAVVDVWDALRSDRPYRAAWSEDRVRAYLLENRGKHFDQGAVETFLELQPEMP